LVADVSFSFLKRKGFRFSLGRSTESGFAAGVVHPCLNGEADSYPLQKENGSVDRCPPTLSTYFLLSLVHTLLKTL